MAGDHHLRRARPETMATIAGSSRGGATASTRRNALELRPIKMQRSLLPNQDGSALFAFGPVAALAAVSGPTEVRIRDERTDRAALQIHFTPLQGIAGTSSTTFEQALQGIWTHALQLHLYPRALMQIHLQTYSAPAVLAPRPVADEDEAVSSIVTQTPPVQPPHPDAAISVALKAAHINATTLACLDAATNMRCLVAASSAAVVRRGIRENRMRGWRAGEESIQARQTAADQTMKDADEEHPEDAFEIILDPSPFEESVARSVHIFAFSFELLPKTVAGDQSMGDDADNDLTDRLQAQMLYSDSVGLQEGNDYFDCLTLCRQASRDIVLQIRKQYASLSD